MPSRVNKALILATAATLVALAGVAPALAADRFAEPGGNGPAVTCPQADPCDIQTAVEGGAVSNGDVITLLPGTYPIATDTVQPTDAVTIQGLAGQPRPLIVAGTSYAIWLDVPGSVLRRVAIEQGPGVGSALVAGAGTVESVVAHSDSPFEACHVAQVTIRDSVCWNSGGGDAIFGQATGGSLTTTLRNVTAFGQSAPAIRLTSGSGSITVNATNLIAYGAPVDIRASASGTGNAATVIADHSNYLFEDEVGTSNGTAFITNPGTNQNQTSAPLFGNASGGDFHQLAGSPTINAGSAAAGLGSSDIDGEARFQGPAPDIGADEFTEAGAGDTTAPETTILSGPRRRVKTRKRRIRATFRFVADDPSASFECALDGATYASCASPFTKRVRRGRHSFEVRGFDATGNLEPQPASESWRVKRKR